VVITTNVSIGAFVIINLCSTVGHDVSIGDYSTLSCHCDVTGGCALGADVFLGSHASILPCIRVADRAKIGAGSAVVRHVRAGVTVFGVPAKRLRG
jgi:serine acetyltransferase